MSADMSNAGKERKEPSLEDLDLDGLRKGIDRIDTRIHDLIMERAKYVLRVGVVKEKAPGSAVFYRPEREARIHRRLEERHRGELPVAALHRIFREIISASLSMEKRLSVAYLGPEATFTHQATLKHFGSAFKTASCRTIDEVFHEVEVERADFGVVPVENSTEGIVIHTLDRFVDSPLKICAEIMLPVVHNLLSLQDDLSRIKRVYGHFRAVSECRKWLDRHLPGVKVVQTKSTAEAAEMARHKGRSAAIAGVYAADNYGLSLMAEHIEDTPGIANRFLVVGNKDPGRSGKDKTSLIFSLQDQKGYLHRVLGIFADKGINLTRIESRPSKKRAWDYLFFVDLEGHQDDPHVAEALEELSQAFGTYIKVLGSYPIRAI